MLQRAAGRDAERKGTEKSVGLEGFLPKDTVQVMAGG